MVPDKLQRQTIGYRFLLPRHGMVGATIGLLWFSGCSLQNFDDLTRGAGGASAATMGGAGAGTSSSTATATGGHGGSIESTAGGSSGGLAGAAGAAVPSLSGGTASGGGGGTKSTGGTSSTRQSSAGSMASGGLVGTSGAATCPAFTGTGGTPVIPPSADFETEPEAPWTTTSNQVSSVYRVQAPGSACEGNWYLMCDPTRIARQAGWDGPAIELLSYVVAGHKYQVSVAVRFDPLNAPTSAKNIGFTISKNCSDSTITTTYQSLMRKTTQTGWIRLDGYFSPDLAGCSQLSRVVVYVETDDTEKSFAIDVDDFHLVDIPVTSSGAGGSGNTGGVAGSAGVGGIVGSAGSAGDAAGVAGVSD
jgi:hypothetical protein